MHRYRYQADLPSGGAPVWAARGVHEGQVILHDHDFFEVELVEAGSAEHISIHGRERVAAGHLHILHPGQWHGYERVRKLLLHDIYFRLDLFARELAWMRDDPRLSPLVPLRMPRDDRERRAAPQGVLSLRLDARRFAAVRARCEDIRALGAGGASARRRGELIARALLLFEAIADHPAVSRRATHADPRLAAAQGAISRDLARPWSVRELAEHAGLSEPHLTRLMRGATGHGPIAWLTRRRAERLAVLLLTDARDVAELGREVGWADPSYCARRFRACFGMAPAEYRNRNARENPRNARR